MPKLTIVIGANGAGKSTWCDQHRARRLPTDFYNADSIAQGLGSWNSPRKQRTAREVVDYNIEKHLTERSNFGFESTYSGSSRPDIVRRAKQSGFTIEAIFVGTTRPEINVKRVARRVATRTGHDVPKKEIHRRWKAAQDNLATTAEHIDLIELLDNSGKTRRSVVRIKSGRITDRGSRVPKWAAELATRATKQQVREHKKSKIQKGKLEPPERRDPYTSAVIPHHPTAKLHPLSRVHASAEIGARTIIEAGAQVQRNAKIDKDTIVRENSYVYENARIGESCDISALYVGRNAKLGNNVKLQADTSVGDNAIIEDAVQLETGARVGHDTTVHEKTKLGSYTYVHHDASIGDNVTTGKKVRIGKECTLEAYAHLDDGAVMEPGSTVCAGSKIKRNAVVREGETIPRSTLVAIDGTREPLPIDHEIRVHPDDRRRGLPETPPPAPAAEAAHRANKRGHDGPSR